MNSLEPNSLTLLLTYAKSIIILHDSMVDIIKDQEFRVGEIVWWVENFAYG